MKIYTTLNIGEFHTNHCEDFWIHESIGTNEKLIAVLDGCTMGTESVFASILIGKILRKIAKKYYYQEFVIPKTLNLKSKLKLIIRELFIELKHIKNQLDLHTNELLSTLIIGIVDTQKNEGELLTVGDGLICCDGNLTEYEQDDKPDYLAYHLDEEYDLWFDNQKQKLSIMEFKDISICTDGIFTFKNLQERDKQMEESEIIDYLLKDCSESNFDNMFERKIRFLKQNMNHIVTDDLAVIRIIMSPQQ
ncbi:protein phosphatase 2C domain-containing protein [Plebeiibacterium sediminum]|uniref:Protein phosphatase 2C domain-containing protein n=1 Tax=Plebeiibacterium sediminum TaxID=2992112 RepID=A0AAE3M327_9BACT|nr:protein phosphatase 2C domain-containing protein [Plebeiobacterium sediminum]MCW3786326.1 protein phosphatase 2C domain-containing protein [Plebeiobacterium sediminum]